MLKKFLFLIVIWGLWCFSAVAATTPRETLDEAKFLNIFTKHKHLFEDESAETCNEDVLFEGDWFPTLDEAEQIWKYEGLTVGSQIADEEEEYAIIMPDVIQVEEDRFLMYFTVTLPSGTRIDVAESPNGIDDWTIIGTALEGSDDPEDLEHVMGGARVIQLEDGTFRMYYRASPAPIFGEAPLYQIFSAISEDGIHFEREDGVRISIHEYDSSSIFTLAGHGTFYTLEDGSFAGIFSGNWVDDEEKEASDLVLATSEDGLHWENFELLYENFHDPSVVKTEEGYVLYSQLLKEDMYLAVSENGVDWPEELNMKVSFLDEDNCVLAAGGNAGDQGLVYTEDGHLYLYGNYGSLKKNNSDIAVYKLVLQ